MANRVRHNYVMGQLSRKIGLGTQIGRRHDPSICRYDYSMSKKLKVKVHSWFLIADAITDNVLQVLSHVRSRPEAGISFLGVTTLPCQFLQLTSTEIFSQRLDVQWAQAATNLKKYSPFWGLGGKITLGTKWPFFCLCCFCCCPCFGRSEPWFGA